MKTRPVLVAAAACALVLGIASPAVADDTMQPGTSYAAAANVTPGTGISPQVSTNGDLADLLDFLAPVSDEFVSPVSDALSQLPATMTADLAADLNDSYIATSGDDAQSAPAGDSYPDCSSAGWNSDNCYSAADIISAVNPVVSVNAARAEGYAAADGDAAASAAKTTGVELSALGVNVGSLGTASATTTCPLDAACSTTGTFADASLLDGAVKVRSASDGSVEVAVAGDDYQPLSGLGDGTTVNDGDISASVKPLGEAVEVSIDLTLDQLLAGLGVANDLADLSAYDAGSTITLDVILGGQDGGASNNRGSGLRVGIGVNADIEVSVFGLVGDSVTVQDTPTGNATDLQLAFTTANSPTTTADTPADEVNVK